MLIEIDKYQPNSLRKVRIDALEKDFSDAFTLFSNKFYDPRSIAINDFLLFWTSSQLRFIIYVTVFKIRSVVKIRIKMSSSKRLTKF
jgi:hypothetical protein